MSASRVPEALAKPEKVYPVAAWKAGETTFSLRNVSEEA
jgi:hypothetical protein